MPWKETRVTDERMMFVAEYLEDESTMSALCRRYGISRKTGYKWVGRYEREGPGGLEDRSRAPHRHPNGIAEDVKGLIVEMRKKHEKWGPKKLRAKLAQKHPGRGHWPAHSSIGALLKREGMIPERALRNKAKPSPTPLTETQRGNHVWCADFKGRFRTGDGRWCEPLTITDNHTRFLLRCDHVARTGLACVQPLFEAAFREFGLPELIRTDNGSPFASHGLGGLSKLSVWWIQLGITPEHIEPGKPQQNGRHERMHRTLAEETASPPAHNACAQQIRFDRFRQEYNYERPHEALDMQNPGALYAGSPRPYPDSIEDFEYDRWYLVRKVQSRGEIHVNGRRIFISEAFYGQRIALQEIEGDLCRIWFHDFELGLLALQNGKVVPHPCLLKKEANFKD